MSLGSPEATGEELQLLPQGRSQGLSWKRGWQPVFGGQTPPSASTDVAGLLESPLCGFSPALLFSGPVLLRKEHPYGAE